jgi:hypothetical protein
MQKPTFIEQFQQQMQGGNPYQAGHFLENSFEQEVEPI